MNGKPPEPPPDERGIMPKGKLTLTYYDESQESSNARFTGVEIDEVNLVAQTAAMTALIAAVNGITMGTLIKSVRQFDEDNFAKTKPGDNEAQREKKWLVTYEDNVTFKHYTSELPCADLSLLSGDGEKADMTDAAVIAFVTAFEGYVLSPADNAVSVIEIRYVGRNL